MAKIGPREQALREMRNVKPTSASAAVKPAPAATPAKCKETTMDLSTETTTAAAKRKSASGKKKAPSKAKTKKTKAAKPRAGKKAAAPKAAEVRAGSKLETIVALLTRPEGCLVSEVLKATGWPTVSMPQQAKAANLNLRKEKDGKVSRYFGAPIAA